MKKPPRHDPHTTQRLRLVSGELTRPGARLLVIHGESLGLCVEVADQAVTVGRAPSCEMLIDHRSVSRMHCTVWGEAGQFFVRDLGSTNRTLVNGQVVDQGALKDGDTIAIGEIVLKFLRRESLEDRYHQAMVEMANVDALTQLPNRRVWREALERAVVQASDGIALSLAFVDLDHFKRINDELGHLAGDEVLKAVAEVIRESTGAGYQAGRLGGEEFGVILPGLDLQRAGAYAERLRKSIEALQVKLAGSVRQVTTSIGVVQWHAQMQTTVDFMRAADQQLFRAKAEGRNRVCLNSPP